MFPPPWPSGVPSCRRSSSRWVFSSARPARIPGRTGRRSASSTRRTTGETTSCFATSSGATTRSGPRPRRDQRDRSRDRRRRRASELPSRVAHPVGELAVRREREHGLHSARTQIFTRFFPRCGVPDAFSSWAEYESFVRFLYETGSITEHTQLWWSVRPHLAFPTVEIRICDGQPEPRGGPVAGSARRVAGGADRTRLRRGDARRAAPEPSHRGEPVARDPLGAFRASSSTSPAARPSRRGSASRSWSNGCCPPPRRSAPRRTSRSRSRTRRSARSSASRTVRRSRRSTPSRCGRPRRSVADEPQLPTEDEAPRGARQGRRRGHPPERALRGRVDRVPSCGARLARSRTGAPGDRSAARARAGPPRRRCGRRDRSRPRAGAHEPPACVRVPPSVGAG